MSIFKNLAKFSGSSIGIDAEQLPNKNIGHFFSVHHTLSNFRGILKAEKDEELRNHAFMGVWAATAGFYNFLTVLDNESPTRCLWNTPPKTGWGSEGEVGADFGIAFQVSNKGPSGESEHHYRIAYFQAKNNNIKGRADFKTNHLEIDRLSSGSKASPEQIKVAVKDLDNWITNRSSYEFKNKTDVEFQVYGLARTDNGFNWTHFVIWDKEFDTACISLRLVEEKLYQIGINDTQSGGLSSLSYSLPFVTEKTKNPNVIEGELFKDLLLRALDDNPVGWRRCDVKEAADLIKKFQSLGTIWFIEKDSSDDGGMAEELGNSLEKTREKISKEELLDEIYESAKTAHAKRINAKP